MTAKSTFESCTCSRCGGSGKFSFNQMDGDRCYGCCGTGWVLTKRGKAASMFYKNSLEKSVSDLVVGDQVMDYIGVSGPKVWCTVSDITPDTLNAGRVILTLTRKGREVCSTSVFATSVMSSIKSEAERVQKLNAALAYQETLTKTGTVRKAAK